MEDQRDDCRADTVEDTGDRLQIAEIDIESAQSGNDHEVWKDESPAAYPGTPKTAAQVRNINSDLNRERSGQRLAYGNGFTHLVFGEPATLGNEFTLHLADQRNRTAEAQQSEPEKIQKQLGQRATFYCRLHCHVSMPFSITWAHPGLLSFSSNKSSPIPLGSPCMGLNAPQPPSARAGLMVTPSSVTLRSVRGKP